HLERNPLPAQTGLLLYDISITNEIIQIIYTSNSIISIVLFLSRCTTVDFHELSVELSLCPEPLLIDRVAPQDLLQILTGLTCYLVDRGGELVYLLSHKFRRVYYTTSGND